MKKQELLQWAQLLALPVLKVLLGLVLLFNPDSTSALVGRVLGWALVLIGVGVTLAAILDDGDRVSRILWAAAFLIAGAWLLKNPLALAEIIGRVFSLFLLIQGGRSLYFQVKYEREPMEMLFSAAIALIGLVMFMLPMSASRIFFTICGVGLICLGTAEGVHRLRHPNAPGGDPDIIDAEKL